MLEYLKIIAASWPIAVMVVGLATTIGLRLTLKQALGNSRARREMEEAREIRRSGQKLEVVVGGREGA